MGYKVAVIIGGGPAQREFSIRSGANISQALQHVGHTVVIIEANEQLVPTLAAEAPDCAYIAIPGRHGESGSLQNILEFMGIPFIGSPAAACSRTWNKFSVQDTMGSYHKTMDDFAIAAWPQGFCLSKDAFENLGAQAALGMIEQNMREGFPVVVKPAHGVGAMAVHKVENQEQLFPAIMDVFAIDDHVVVQQWVTGVELAVCVLGSEWDAYALPPVEIVPKKGWYDRASRVDPSLVDYYAPVRSESLFPEESGAQAIRAEIERAALEVYRAYGLRDMARIDLIWDGARACVLEVNVAPNVTDISMLPAACRAAGLTFPAVLNELVEIAVARGANTGSI